MGVRPRGGGDYETVPKGIYTFQIVKVEDAYWEYKGNPKEGFKFTCAILDENDIPDSDETTRGRYVWYRTSNSISKRSDLHKLAVALFGRELTDEEIDTSEDNDELLDPVNDMLGLQFKAYVVHNEDKEGRIWANLSKDTIEEVDEDDELEPVENLSTEETTKQTRSEPVKKTPMEEAMDEDEDEYDEEDLDDEDDEDEDDVLANPVLDEIIGDLDDEDEEEDEEDDEEEEDEEDEEDLEAAEEAARKAKERLEKIKASKKKAKKTKSSTKKSASKKSKSVAVKGKKKKTTKKKAKK